MLVLLLANVPVRGDTGVVTPGRRDWYTVARPAPASGKTPGVTLCRDKKLALMAPKPNGEAPVEQGEAGSTPVGVAVP